MSVPQLDQNVCSTSYTRILNNDDNLNDIPVLICLNSGKRVFGDLFNYEWHKKNKNSPLLIQPPTLGSHSLTPYDKVCSSFNWLIPAIDLLKYILQLNLLKAFFSDEEKRGC